MVFSANENNRHFSAQIFLVRRFWGFSLIINGEVGSLASYCFPKLRKNFPLLRAVRNNVNSSYFYLTPILFNFYSSYTDKQKQAKESFMIVRFWWYDRKKLTGKFQPG